MEFSKDSRIVKKSFIDIHSFYRKYDTDGNLRLTYDELEKCEFLCIFARKYLICACLPVSLSIFVSVCACKVVS